MKIKVGNAPVSWGVMEVAGWGAQQVPCGRVLDEIGAAGYAGTELGPYGYFPTEPERLKSELAMRGLELIGGFVPLPLAHAERHDAGYREAMRVAELLSQAGAPLVVLADEMCEARVAVSGRVAEDCDGMSDAQWKGAARLLSRVSAECRRMGLSAVFHHHAGTFVETPQEIARLCEATDPDLLGLCLDTGHYTFGGGDPAEAARLYGSRIRHLHLKDVRLPVLEAARRDRAGFLEAVRRGVFCELGEGSVDLKRVINDLSAAGYSAWALVEQDVDTRNPEVKPFESALRSREYLRKEIGI
ncbi:MAG: TIM barrel protein [Acidobacteria bacterium]|nr:TIM barrel protein [Acidobacteriota bacterium]MCA1641661.1 TIM barrel protein [Acidobacteriota bacterium]